jgi:HAD superfamily hydrolase (TIGR01509 family)
VSGVISGGPDAILFDFDGVLADTEPIHFACWNQVLAQFGIHVPWDIYARECIGISDRMMIERLAAQCTPPLAFETVWAEYPRKQSFFRERIESEPPFLEETLNFLRELARQFPMAVVSSSGRTEVEPPLVRAGVGGCFQAMVCGREVANLKPAPDPYLRAAELLGVRSPLVIEDSDAGIASATAAGFRSVRVTGALAMVREVRAALGLGSA